MNHREMCEDLAAAKQTIFIEVNLGSKWLQRPQVADVINIRPSYTRFCIDIYECKVSRPDFLNDLRSEKWRGYLDHCHRFYFAILPEVNFLTFADDKPFSSDVPEECGLLIRGSKGWKTQKQAKVRNIEIPEMTLLSLLFYRKKWLFNHQYRYELKKGFINRDKFLKKLGKNVAKAVQHYEICKKENFINYY